MDTERKVKRLKDQGRCNIRWLGRGGETSEEDPAGVVREAGVKPGMSVCAWGGVQGTTGRKGFEDEEQKMLRGVMR